MDSPEAKGSVLLVGNFLSAAGRSRGVCEDLAVRLQRSGWRMLCTSSKPGRIARLLDVTTTIWRRRAEYRVAQVDVFSGPGFLLAMAAARALQAARKPYVLTLHGGDLPAFTRRWPAAVRRLLQSAEAVTAPSRYLLEALRPYRPDLELLPNPLDASSYPFTLRASPRSRLIWLRAFHEIYNPSLAPRVLARLRAHHPDVHLTMFGPDKGDGSLEKTRRVAAELGVADRLTMAGPVAKTDVPQAISQGDVFLNTSHIDNTPVSVLEAMACGLCVVSTDVGGMPYLIEHERNGLLVPRDDADAMAAAVSRLLAEPALAAQLSQNARLAAEQCDWSLVLPRWETLFDRLKVGPS